MTAWRLVFTPKQRLSEKGHGFILEKNRQTQYIYLRDKETGKENMHIKIFTTGGTIDKVYFDEMSAYQVGPPNISSVFEELKLAFTYTIESLMKKDSLELTDEDRITIVRAVARDASERILITHGTDTMVQTAKKLADIQGKTIVLTGALKPALFKTTDAVFNIGCAVIAAQTLPPGVYIVMNGCVFTHDQVRKNRQQGMFETLSSSEK